MRVALVAAQLVALRGEPPAQLRHDPVHGGQILDRPARQRAVEVGQRALRRQRLVALDLGALELAPQRLLEAPQLLARDAVAARIVRRQLRLGLGPQAQRPADALDVDAEHAGALALAERRDRQSREVAQVGLRALLERLRDLTAQLVEVDLIATHARLRLGHLEPYRLYLGGAEEEAVEDQVEDATVLGRLGDRGRERLAEVGGRAPVDELQRLKRVEQLGGADRHALGAQILAEGDELPVEVRLLAGHRLVLRRPGRVRA